MQRRRVIYPVEPGFIWLRKQDDLWTGWSPEPPKFEGEVNAQLEILAYPGYDGIDHETCFLYFDPIREGSKWQFSILEPEAQHFDLGWGLPEKQMDSNELKFLRWLLDHYLARPVRKALEAQAA